MPLSGVLSIGASGSSGSKLWSASLSLLEASQQLLPEGLPAGGYAYRLLVDEHLQVGKVGLVR